MSTDSEYLAGTWPDFALLGLVAAGAAASAFPVTVPPALGLTVLGTALLVFRLNLRMVEVLKRRRGRRAQADEEPMPQQRETHLFVRKD